MRILGIERDAKNLYSLILIYAVLITKRACLLRATGCIVFRVKVENYPLTAKIRQVDRVVVCVTCGEIRRLIAFLQHRSISFGDDGRRQYTEVRGWRLEVS
jgi:hypothetical protein